MFNLKLRKQLRGDIPQSELLNMDEKEISRCKAVFRFLRKRCLSNLKTKNDTLHLKLATSSELVERAESKEERFITITVDDVQKYARLCNLKFEKSEKNGYCIISL